MAGREEADGSLVLTVTSSKLAGRSVAGGSGTGWPWLRSSRAAARRTTKFSDSANSCSAEPPMRDAEGWVVQVRTRRILSLHALTTHGANHEDTNATRLPAPEQPLLYRLDEPALAELIERQIEYVDETHRSVHLASVAGIRGTYSKGGVRGSLLCRKPQ